MRFGRDFSATGCGLVGALLSAADRRPASPTQVNQDQRPRRPALNRRRQAPRAPGNHLPTISDRLSAATAATGVRSYETCFRAGRSSCFSQSNARKTARPFISLSYPTDGGRKAEPSSCRGRSRWLWPGYASWDDFAAFACGLVATDPQPAADRSERGPFKRSLDATAPVIHPARRETIQRRFLTPREDRSGREAD